METPSSYLVSLFIISIKCLYGPLCVYDTLFRYDIHTMSNHTDMYTMYRTDMYTMYHADMHNMYHTNQSPIWNTACHTCKSLCFIVNYVYCMTEPKVCWFFFC